MLSSKVRENTSNLARWLASMLFAAIGKDFPVSNTVLS
jgi:hypothetical protein